MFSIYNETTKHGAATATRREVLRIGGLATLGLSSTDLIRLRAHARENGSSARHNRNSCVFVFLFGGPSHIDLWDMKPDAPAEIRGQFKPIATRVPGIDLCEHLPLLAARSDLFCLVRSMTHSMPVHGPACSELYSGRPYFGPPTTDQARPEDWPSLASIVARFGKKGEAWPPSIVLPWYTQFAGQDKPIAGQVGGRMGSVHRPFLISGDPSQADFQVPGLRLPGGLPLERLAGRRSLLESLDSAPRNGVLPPQFDRVVQENYQTAFAMLDDERTARAFEIGREPPSTRDRYGRTKFAQSLLLARRLVEAGITLITVNYDDETRGEKVSPFWDTHNQNFPQLKERLAPRFDQAFSAFLEDLDRRGLLETTLVVVTGEFGRTPRIGQTVQNNMTDQTGRDHWPHAFTAILAGGGVRGGQVYGETNNFGSYVKDKPVSPADLAATILRHLGVDPAFEYWDEFQQVNRRLSIGSPIKALG
jgi:hypothetical protein